MRNLFCVCIAMMICNQVICKIELQIDQVVEYESRDSYVIMGIINLRTREFIIQDKTALSKANISELAETINFGKFLDADLKEVDFCLFVCIKTEGVKSIIVCSSESELKEVINYRNLRNHYLDVYVPPYSPTISASYYKGKTNYDIIKGHLYATVGAAVGKNLEGESIESIFGEYKKYYQIQY